MDNKALWKRAFTTDPKAVKPITGKQYSGNSPKPYWIIERLTDEFGPCGIGWGFSVINERIERFSDTDSLHIALIDFWYELDGKRGGFQQMGQTKASYMSGSGKFIIDEDAPKKSVTDALVKCASYLGFAGDIFSGRWDDSKYVKEAGAFWEARLKLDALPPEERAALEKEQARQAELADFAAYLIECHESNNDLEAIRLWYSAESWSTDNPTETEEKKTVWAMLKPHSKLRSAINANRPEARTKEAA